MKPFYTPKELIEILGFSKNTIYKYLEEGKIKSTRVGKGSFRVPASEVERWLQGGRKKVEVVSETGKEAGGIEIPVADEVEVWAKEHLGGEHVANLFDWLMGLLAVGVGFALFLFPVYFYELGFAKVLPYFLVMRFGLILGGIAFLAVDVLRMRQEVWGRWHEILHIILGLMFGVLAGLIYMGQDHLEGALVYGSMAGVLLVTAVVRRVRPVVRFIWLVFWVNFLPGVVWLAVPDLYPAMKFMPWGVVVGWWLVVPIGVFGLSLKAVKEGKQWYRWLSWYNGVVFLAWGMFAVYQAVWDWAVVSILLGVFSGVFPYWQRFNVSRDVSNRRLAVAFSYIGVVVVAGLVVVSLVRSSVENVVQSHLSDRAKNNARQVSEFLQQAERELVGEAESSLVKESLIAGDRQGLELLFKEDLRSAGAIRRLLVFDREGAAMAVYPKTDPDIGGDNFKFREYVQRGLAGEVYLSDAFQATAENNMWAVALAVPMVDKEGRVSGVMVGGVDLVKLQELMGEKKVGRDGFVTVMDRTRRMVVHPNKNKQFTLVEDGSVVGEGFRGEERGSGKQYGGNGEEEVLMLKAFEPVDDWGWAVVVEQPVSEVTMVATGISLIVFLVMFGLSTVWLAVATVKDRPG